MIFYFFFFCGIVQKCLEVFYCMHQSLVMIKVNSEYD